MELEQTEFQNVKRKHNNFYDFKDDLLQMTIDPEYEIKKFMQRQRFHERAHNCDTLYQPAVSNAQCITVREKDLAVGIHLE